MQQLDEDESVEDTLSSLAEAFDLCYNDVLWLYECHEGNVEAFIKAVAKFACY